MHMVEPLVIDFMQVAAIVDMSPYSCKNKVMAWEVDQDSGTKMVATLQELVIRVKVNLKNLIFRSYRMNK